MSLINFDRKSIPDSGIESLGASHDKRQLKRRISKLRRQPQIAEIVLMPYEVYFNGGIFTFKLFQYEAEAQRRFANKDKETTELPLLEFVLDRPNVFIRQTNYEKCLKVSLANCKVYLADFVKQGRQLILLKIPIVNTLEGESDHTGAKKSLIELKHVKFLSKPEEIELSIQRPVKVSLSHVSIKRLLHMYETVMIPLQKKRNSVPEILPIPAKKRKLFERVRTLVGGLRRFNINFAQLVFELSDHTEYDLKLLISQTEITLGLVERIERVNCILKVKNAFITSLSKTILHPTSLGLEVVFTQETWKKEPLVTINLRGNFIQLDLNAQLYEELKVIQTQMSNIFGQATAELSFVESRFSASDTIEISPPAPTRKLKKMEVQYEDDLRAGAFQFVQTSSLTELPLPYQIQIYSNKDKNIICWRYPQPRLLTHLKIFPIPVQFERPTMFQCTLEYYCATVEQFKEVRVFNIHEDSVVVDLPSRIICSSIWRVTATQITLPSDEDDDDDDENVSFEEALNSDFHEIKPTTQFNPQIFAGCMRVDSIHNPALIPSAEVLLQVAHVQVNLITALSGGRLPTPLKAFTFVGDMIPAHPCVSLNLDNIRTHASIFQALDRINLDGEVQLGVDVMDYSEYRYQPLLESFKAKIYSELTSKGPLHEASR